jgi:hypothetical protein
MWQIGRWMCKESSPMTNPKGYHNVFRKCRECGRVLALVIIDDRSNPPHVLEKAVSHEIPYKTCSLFTSSSSQKLWNTHINDPDVPENKV